MANTETFFQFQRYLKMRANMQTFVKCYREESWKERLPQTNGINLIPIVEQLKVNQLLTDSFRLHEITDLFLSDLFTGQQ